MTGVTVQSGWPGMRGVLVPQSQSRRKPDRSWPEISEVRAM
ncbi:hypothetical protein M878_05890 [Streptomyces roseochromogenus subsp. oscitans DS 12.976]|uniref:Uncharacterized protein n=1 Tax=Streptomyces roseochromogenus subsp. oscitans DS 12.976 TaxID=1352936 RepID=V6KTT7_STRRC|nr:hypothetical protein M878_05890 [Streptomyces roseochromogenus subsp. oscitans DS 12.976]